MLNSLVVRALLSLSTIMNDPRKIKYRYNSYTAGFKVRVILYAEKHGNRAAEREFGISEAHVRYWRRQKESLINAKMSSRAFRGPKEGKYPQLEEELLKYVQELRNNGNAVNHEMLQNRAREIARSNGIPHNQFKASRGWAWRFMRRKNLSLRRRTTLCQRLPMDYTEKVVAFHRHVIRMRQTNNYLLSQIGNADQTPVYFDMPSNTTIEEKGASSVPIITSGAEKQRCTVMLAVTSDGRKLPPYIIFRRKTIPKGSKFPAGVHVMAQEKGWMNCELMLDWIEKVWKRRPGALLRKKSLLVLDSFRGHLIQDVKSRLQDAKTDLAVIPGGLTSVLQPLDVSVNKPFKQHIRQSYSEWMANSEHEYTPGGKIKKPTLNQMCEWILSAWRSISPAIVERSFKKTGISNSLDGSEDDACFADRLAAATDDDATSEESEHASVTSDDDGDF